MIGQYSGAGLSVHDLPTTNLNANSVPVKRRKPCKKNRWRPYAVVPMRVFCKPDMKSTFQPCTSKKQLKHSSEILERIPDKEIIPIAVSNSGYSSCAAVESTCLEKFEDTIDITHLPKELVVKILSNLDIRNISVCRLVNHSWQELVDGHHLQAISFSRCLHRQPIPPTVSVDHYVTFTRGLLAASGDRGKALVDQLDELLEHQDFSKILFFAIAEVFAKKRSFKCPNVCTLGHSSSINSASFSPDARHLVTASHDSTAKIWGLAFGRWEEKATIRHSSQVINASFSPDGSHLATASHDHTAKIWELVAGQWQERATIEHSHMVNSANFSPDGRLLVTASHDQTAKVWELAAGQWKEKQTIWHPHFVRNASFNPDGRLLATACCDDTAKIWVLVAGQWLEKTTIHHGGWVNTACFSPDGHYLATASYDKTTKILGVSDDQWHEIAVITHSEPMSDVRFSPDGSHLVTLSGDNTAKIWRLVAGQWCETAIISHFAWVSNASFSPDGNHLVTTSRDRTAKIWGLFAGQWREKAIIWHATTVRSACFSPDGSQLVTTGGRDQTAKIWLLK